MKVLFSQFATLIFLMFFLTEARSADWPVLKNYDQEHLCKIALPIGGIGTGTISFGGRGNFQDMEIMNRPAKAYDPGGNLYFTLFTDIEGEKDLRLLEGPIPCYLYQSPYGALASNSGLPRFDEAEFETAYPFGQVKLRSSQVPLRVKVKSFNPLIPGNIDDSSIPMAVIDFELMNTSEKEIKFSICGNLQNFIGEDGSYGKATDNKNVYYSRDGLKGILFTSDGVNPASEQWGEISLVCASQGDISYRTSWLPKRWGTSLLDYRDDLIADGQLDNRIDEYTDKPIASLAVGNVISAGETKTLRFLLTWYFPNRKAWSSVLLKNYYTTKYKGAWDVAAKTLPRLRKLEDQTIEFVNAFCKSDFPDVVKEAALFNISTLRTQTCFRLSDGNFLAWEGCGDRTGSCFGNCTHVWNYETATAFLFGDLARSMRKIEFDKATTDEGIMSFRVKLPFEEIPQFLKVAADGQMGCVMKLYREWQLSGDNNFLKSLYPKAKSALGYAWKKGGWDADQDGVMEGVQHNTMDVEYYGPNPQMTIWYLGALRAMEEMARHMKDEEMVRKCKELFKNGSLWTDEKLFNGEYYIHKIEIPNIDDIPEETLIGMGSADYGSPDYQLGEGCLVDQLVGQYMAHVCGLGYLVNRDHIGKTLQSIMKYNYKADLSNHFNCMRTFALGNESGLLMASYPKGRPDPPFPYFTEVMSGFEYTAAVGMLYEGQKDNGLKCIRNIRARYDGKKRNPFNEAECGHHYGRAMASWSTTLALSGFNYSGSNKTMSFTSKPGNYFWSNGYAWGTGEVDGNKLTLNVLYGQIELCGIALSGLGSVTFENILLSTENNKIMTFEIE